MAIVGLLNKGTKVLYNDGTRDFKALVGEKQFMNGREKVILMRSTNRRLGSVDPKTSVTLR